MVNYTDGHADRPHEALVAGQRRKPPPSPEILRPRIARSYFIWLPRTEGMTYANDPRYEIGSATAILARLNQEADAVGIALSSIEPTVGWIRKRHNEDNYSPCTEFAQGATPAWIWTAVQR